MMRWSPDRNPTVRVALMVDTEYLGAPRSCFRAESSEMSQDNKAEIKGSIFQAEGCDLPKWPQRRRV